MRIESIADHLDLGPTIARWHWDEWGHADPEGSLKTWTVYERLGWQHLGDAYYEGQRVAVMYVDPSVAG